MSRRCTVVMCVAAVLPVCSLDLSISALQLSMHSSRLYAPADYALWEAVRDSETSQDCPEGASKSGRGV